MDVSIFPDTKKIATIYILSEISDVQKYPHDSRLEYNLLPVVVSDQCTCELDVVGGRGADTSHAWRGESELVTSDGNNLDMSSLVLISGTGEMALNAAILTALHRFNFHIRYVLTLFEDVEQHL